MRRLIGWLLAGCWLVGLVLLGSPVPAHADPPTDTVAELVQRLRQDPVQVNTLMGAGDTAAVDAALTELAEQVPVPVYVVLDLMPQQREPAEQDFREGERLVAELSTELGDGLYVLALGTSAESIIGHSEVVAVGVEDQLRSDYAAGARRFFEVSSYPTPEALRVYLGLRALVEGPEAVAGLDAADLRAEVPWAYPSSLEAHQESLTRRLVATVVIPLALVGLLAGALARRSRVRRRTGVPGPPGLARRVALVVAVGVPVTAALTFGVASPQVVPRPSPGEQEIAAADVFAAGESVYLSKDLAGWLSEDQLRRITAAADTAPVPTRVALWYPTQATDGLELTASSLDEPAMYLTASPDEVDGFDFALADDLAWVGPRWEAQADPALFTQTVLDLLAESAAAGARAPEAITYHPVLGVDAPGTLGAAAVLGIAVAGFGAGLGWLLVVVTGRGRTGAGPGREPGPGARRRVVAPEVVPGTPAPGTGAPPETAVREAAEPEPAAPEPVAPGRPTAPAAGVAETAGSALSPRPPEPLAPGTVERWERSARYELGNLQRTLRFLGPTAAASPAAAAAQQHAAAAERLLAGSPPPADQLGAWVLARRGTEAAGAATALRPFEPTLGCWFHPEHPAGTQQRSFEGRSVSCCAACAQHLDQGREPELLDLPGPDGQPVHFHRSGAEPWASTGFGVDEPDLPGRLAERA